MDTGAAASAAGASVGSGAGASVGSGAGASVGSTAGAVVGLAVGGASVASSSPQAANKGKAISVKINKPMMGFFFIFPLLFKGDFPDIRMVSCYVPKSIALFLLSFNANFQVATEAYRP
jgi:hypothetical protein